MGLRLFVVGCLLFVVMLLFDESVRCLCVLNVWRVLFVARGCVVCSCFLVIDVCCLLFMCLICVVGVFCSLFVVRRCYLSYCCFVCVGVRGLLIVGGARCSLFGVRCVCSSLSCVVVGYLLFVRVFFVVSFVVCCCVVLCIRCSPFAVCRLLFVGCCSLAVVVVC